MNAITQYFKSSIGKKQIVAITGLLLVGFLVMHLSINLLFFLGAEVFNVFPETMRSSGPVLIIAELGLVALFLTHISFTVIVVKENRQARNNRYEKFATKKTRSLATRLMPYTGTILILFLILHLKDFWWPAHEGVMTMVDGEELGAYGLIFNAFKSIGRVIWYVVAMFSVGFHLAHGIQSVVQTFGFYHKTYTPMIQKASTGFGIVMALAFSSIPVYTLVFG